MSATNSFKFDSEVMNDCLIDLPASEESYLLRSERLALLLHQMMVTGSNYLGSEHNEAWAY